MNFQTMEYFRAIAHEGSFTRAAAKLHVTQQTLSVHVANVERELGCALLVRTSPLRLTHEGEVLLAYAERFERDLTDLRRQMSAGDSDQVGTLRVAVAHTRGRVLMPGVIERMSERFPNVLVELREGTNAAIAQDLLAGNADIAIGDLGATMPGMEARPYYEEEVVLLASEGLLEAHGIRASDIEASLTAGDLTPLASCPFVLCPPEDIAGDLGLRLFAKAGFEPRVRVRSANMETLLALALRGVGACLSPRNLLEATASPEQRRALRAFDLGPDARYAIRFNLPAGGYHWSVTEEFMRIALELAARA